MRFIWKCVHALTKWTIAPFKWLYAHLGQRALKVVSRIFGWISMLAALAFIVGMFDVALGGHLGAGEYVQRAQKISELLVGLWMFVMFYGCAYFAANHIGRWFEPPKKIK